MPKSTALLFSAGLALWQISAVTAAPAVDPPYIVAGDVDVDDNSAVRRARSQPTIPDGYEELPFLETADEPQLTPREKERGYLLFHRPIMDPVHPNTRPRDFERLEQLVAFATPGEWEPVTFSIYPIRELKNLKVRCSPLISDAGEISPGDITVRLVTYWNIGFPRYTSRSTFRRLPELLERVTVHSSPAMECQRYWIQVRVPEGAGPGLYRGTVQVTDDDSPDIVRIPVLLRVLGFRLAKDPAKRYSAYYYVRNRTQYSGKPDSFVRTAADNEYRAMRDYGLDQVPTLYLRCDDGKTVDLPYPEELDRMQAAGLHGPVPVTADSVIGRMYRETTPGGEQGSHWQISKMPPAEFYQRVTAAFQAFDSERKKRGWPEFVCCPVDEVAAAQKEFGARIYAAVKAAGIRTYATKDPTAGDAAPYRPHIDVWCSQPYSVPYDSIVAQHRYEYWSYPNHNACEIKDRRVMCKGGRMTYGFGFWRSGYTTLIPWHWSWTPGDDQFDYLRGRHSGCGQRIDDDGEVIPAIYWDCFREGIDDARYVYTLQQAVFDRADSPDETCRRAVADAQTLLQETWDGIHVQDKYLADGMWPSAEFNTRRWLLANAITRLLQYPATRSQQSPSVLIPRPSAPPAEVTPTVIDKALQSGDVESMDLGGDFKAWANGTSEGRVEFLDPEDSEDARELRWRIDVDHETDGGEGGQYPVGWPRLARTFAPAKLDMSAYDYLSFEIRADSNRDEAADDSTRVGLVINSHQGDRNFFSARLDLGDQPRQWLPMRFSIPHMIQEAGVGTTPWQTISRVQLYISESDYAHGTKLTFDIRNVKLLRFASPVIERVESQHFVMLPQRRLPVHFDVVGTRNVRPGSHHITATMTDGNGQPRAVLRQGLEADRTVVLDISSLTSGRYRLELAIADASGRTCARVDQDIEAVAGPDQE